MQRASEWSGGLATVPAPVGRDQDPAQTARPTPSEVDDALEDLYGFFVANYAAILAMPRSFGSARRGLPLSAEPAELAHSVLSTMADRIGTANERAALSELLAKFCTLGYVFRAMENENAGLARSHRRVRLVAEVDAYEQTVESGGSGSASDVGKLRRLLGVLEARSRRSVVPLTCLTDLHLRCWSAVLAGRGAQAELARELGVDASRISQIKASASAKVREAIYAAGVLGPADALEDEAAIEECLERFDAPEHSGGLTAQDRARLVAAAPTVRVHGEAGQRADAKAAAERYLRRRDKRTVRVELGTDPVRRRAFEETFAEALHAAEAGYAAAVRNPYPNCSANCPPHNPVPGRVVLDVGQS